MERNILGYYGDYRSEKVKVTYLPFGALASSVNLGFLLDGLNSVCLPSAAEDALGGITVTNK